MGHQTSIISKRLFKDLSIRISRSGFASHPEGANMSCKPSVSTERSASEMQVCWRHRQDVMSQIGGMLLPRVFATKETHDYLTEGARQSDVRWHSSAAAYARSESTGNHAGYRSRTTTQVMTFCLTTQERSNR